ncbi:cyclopropane-fatty-acyl-phospholipid synthase family protein [Lichenihabitans sp. PAMC28606]|uniref:SAM-dependent methyltransferase n=1 Tax=Lichenihabitans sp. PAMC28606 TaxID=2880932 RepID=UPI001D0B8E95|nr:cyclopropane-fatty-acyl-phospholipid synthase family protein [Lichenihabitans sp. PAMC28606]UDL95928.1 cyclopropane-fatty-acyl-phospholipid synthase family protein [Lichenihabitans sp. PAMC28606]
MLKSKLNSIFRQGRLTVILDGGKQYTFGDGQTGHEPVVVRLKGHLTPLKIAADPDRFLGQAYMDGDLIMEQGSIYDLLDLAGTNLAGLPQHYPGIIRRAGYKALAAVQQYNNQRRSRRNVAHHYDLSTDLYRLFLDQDLQYSCAYFADPTVSLDDAQTAKKRHIIAKLLLKPGQRVLDIGCGWGGMAISIAQQENVHVLGVTLSTEQLKVARQRVEDLGLQDRVTFELRDYRTLEGTFDRIVSVGMFEHVGTPQYKTYFNTVSRLLAPNGVALIHSIGRNHGIAKPNAWINKYIFPGGYIPSLSEVIPPIETSGLWLTDLEVLRLHYAETLKHWRERFLQRKGELGSLYDERFCRMWEFYLAASEMSFRHGGFMVFQAQLSNSVDAVPLTRDYMVDTADRAPLPLVQAAE